MNPFILCSIHGWHTSTVYMRLKIIRKVRRRSNRFRFRFTQRFKWSSELVKRLDVNLLCDNGRQLIVSRLQVYDYSLAPNKAPTPAYTRHLTFISWIYNLPAVKTFTINLEKNISPSSKISAFWILVMIILPTLKRCNNIFLWFE